MNRVIWCFVTIYLLDFSMTYIILSHICMGGYTVPEKSLKRDIGGVKINVTKLSFEKIMLNGKGESNSFQRYQSKSLMPLIKRYRPMDMKSAGQTVSYGEKMGLKYLDVKIYDVLDGLRKCAKILNY